MADEYKSFGVAIAEKLEGCEDGKSAAIIMLEYIATGLNCPWDPLDVGVMYRDFQRDHEAKMRIDR